MLQNAPTLIQSNMRTRATIAGACSGLVAFMIWRNWGSVDLSQSSALGLAGLSCALAAAAGFFSSVLMPLGKLHKTAVISVTAGSGLRSGLIAALVYAGAIIAASVA